MVRTYLDFKGRAQYAVDGPNGTYLVTRKSMHEDYEVWRSDSIRTAGKAATFEAALARARGYRGLAVFALRNRELLDRRLISKKEYYSAILDREDRL